MTEYQTQLAAKLAVGLLAILVVCFSDVERRGR